MIIGYARTSTAEQEAGLEAQIRDLTKNRVEKIFSEQVSSINAQRPQLAAAMEFAREGDVFVVTKLDRLARSVKHLIEIKEALDKKGVTLVILDMALNTATPMGQLALTIFAAVAQFEREIMLERQKEGIAKAQRDGKYKGRKPTALIKADEIRQMRADDIPASEIAARLNIGLSSVYRILSERGEKPLTGIRSPDIPGVAQQSKVSHGK